MEFSAMQPPTDPIEPGQQGIMEWFRDRRKRTWLPLSGYIERDGAQVGWHSTLAPISYRAEALQDPSWDLTHGTHGPSFMRSGDGQGGTELQYLRTSSAPLEPLAVDRNFNGAKPSYLELCEEFRLFHNLWQDPRSPGNFYTLDESGTPSLAAVVEGDFAWASTPLVRRFQAAKQMDLLLFIDSVVRFDPSNELPARTEWSEPDLSASLVADDGLDSTCFSRLLGTRVLPAPARDQCRIWPFESEGDDFPEYIIATDDVGNEVTFTCDPAQLANYFGANPEAPNYLTPVHFRREVLAKYYKRPEVFTVEAGYLRCAALWGLRMDNDADGSVIVWLGDLGEYLPATERPYWRSFNIAPDRKVSELTYKTAILGEFADSAAADLRFRAEYAQLVKAWTDRLGWPIFRAPEPGDAHLLNLVRLPLNDSDLEFEELVGLLAKLLVDFLNEAALENELAPGPDGEKGIAKLRRWLVQAGYPEAEREVGFLHGLQAVRSKGVAHRKGSDYEKTLTLAVGEKRGAAAATQLLGGALAFVRGLTRFVQPVDEASGARPGQQHIGRATAS